MRDIDSVIAAYLDEGSSADETRALEAWISSDVEHAKEFLRCVAIHNGIRCQLSANRFLRVAGLAYEDTSNVKLIMAEQPCEVVCRETTDVADPEERVSGTASTAVALRMRSLLDRASNRPVPPAIAVALVTVVAVLFALALTPLSSFLAGEGDEEKSDAKARVAEEEIATLSGWQATEWLPGKDISSRNRRIKAGQTMAFKAGLAEITYDTGARVVIEGPAEFTVGADERSKAAGKERLNSGFLAFGVLVARVDVKEAEGFFIDTHNGRVEDLGTEFGIQANERGTQIRVLSGRVAASFASSASNARKTRILENNESLSISPDGKITNGLPEKVADSFTSLRKRILSQSANDANPGEFLQDNSDLLLHYNFEKSGGTRQIVNQGRGGEKLNATVQGAQWRDGHTPHSQSLSIMDRAHHVRMNVPGEFVQLTMLAWVRVEALDRDYRGLLMSDGWNRAGQMHWQIMRDGQIQLAVNNAMSYIQFSHFKMEPQLWYHLAVACDTESREARLYVDGQLVDLQKTGQIPRLVLGGVELGNWVAEPGFRADERYLGGQIGELMIFTRALNAREVRQCFLASEVKR
jgi:hypothetical protein